MGEKIKGEEWPTHSSPPKKKNIRNVSVDKQLRPGQERLSDRGYRCTLSIRVGFLLRWSPSSTLDSSCAHLRVLKLTYRTAIRLWLAQGLYNIPSVKRQQMHCHLQNTLFSFQCSLAEMEFLDIILSLFCSKLLLVPLLADFKGKPYSSLVLNIHTKNPWNKKTRVCSWKTFCRNEKWG
jgi:hypothetical protein